MIRRNTTLGLSLALLVFAVAACMTQQSGNAPNANTASPSPSQTSAISKAVPVTLPVLDALLAAIFFSCAS